jgi:hypothetical protein
VSFDDLDTVIARNAAAERALVDRSDAMRYLGVLASEITALGILILGAALGVGALVALGLVALVPCGWYFNYLAQRAREAVDQGDYLVSVRVQWQAAGYSVGSLVPRAFRALRQQQ